jgi:hypothetical protein
MTLKHPNFYIIFYIFTIKIWELIKKNFNFMSFKNSIYFNPNYYI